MYTLRLTRSLLAGFAPPDPSPSPVAATTTLGDWYVRALRASGRDLLLCTSEVTGLTVVIPADRIAELPEQLVRNLIPLLYALGVRPQAVAAEVDAMTEGIVGPAANPAMTRAMQAIARRVRATLGGARTAQVDVAALHRALADRTRTPGGTSTAGELTVRLLHG